MKRLYRFELAFLGEPQGIGFLVGLRDTGITEETIDALIKEFDDKLPLPHYEELNYNKSVGYPASYFTEKGKEVFYPTISTIINHVQSLDNEWEVIEEMIEVNDTLYEDEFQSIVLKAHD